MNKMNETEIRDTLLLCAYRLSEAFPLSRQDAFRWKSLAETCQVATIPYEHPTCAAFRIDYTEETSYMMVRARNQILDIRPRITGNQVLKERPPVLVLYQDATATGLFHEISHIFSLGCYRPWENDIFHKRGTLIERLENRDRYIIPTQTHGMTNVNECMTDLCAKYLVHKTHRKDVHYVRNQNYTRFLQEISIKRIDPEEVIYAYLHDVFACTNR